jgi:oligopeptide transport system substrate-binding protein
VGCDRPGAGTSDSLTLNLNLGDWPLSTLDPAKATGTASINVIEQLFIGLVDLDDETGEVNPELATSWTVSPNGTVYTFTLRSDITWSDGNPVTAQDVRYGILRTLDPATAADYAYTLYVIKNAAAYNQGTITDPNQVGVTAVNTTTLRVTLEEPGTYALSILSMWIACPMPQWAIEAHGVPTWTEQANIVTNGPYQLTEWVHDDHILLDKNPTYYDAANVQIERVKMWMVDQYTAWQMYLDGQLDTAEVPLGTARNPVLRQEVHKQIDDCTYYYGIVNNKPPLDDVRVRKAFAMSVDKQSLVDNVLGTGQTPADHFAPPGNFGAPELGSVGLGYNPAAARAQLQDYLDDHGMTLDDFNALGITLMHNTSTGHARIAAAIQQNWADNLGVTVTVEHQPWGDYLNIIGKTTPLDNAPHIFRLGWCGDYPDENNWVYEVFHNEAGANRLRRGCLDDVCSQQVPAEFEQVTEQAKGEPNPTTRKDLYLQAESLLAEDEAAYIPLYFYGSFVATKPYLERTYPVFAGYDIATWRITRVSDVIDPGGGDLTSDDGNTTVEIPAGAITDTVVITHTPATGTPPGGNLAGIGHVFDVTAVYSDTGQSAQIASGHTCTITAQYTDTEIGPAIEDTMGLYWWDEGASQWSQQGITSSVNITDNLVTAQVDHFSLFAVLGETFRVYLPLILRDY